MYHEFAPTVISSLPETLQPQELSFISGGDGRVSLGALGGPQSADPLGPLEASIIITGPGITAALVFRPPGA